MDKTTLNYGLEYSENKISIIPLLPKSKIPSIPSWQKYQNVHAEKDLIVSWFSNGWLDGNNIALVTGKVSRIIALDIDNQEARTHLQKVIENIDDEGIRTAIQNTMQIKTGSGNINIVFGFKVEEFPDNQSIKNTVLWHSKENRGHNEIRLKGEGGYIVAPPSTYSGNRYEQVNRIEDLIILFRAQINKLISALKGQHGNNTDQEKAIDTPINKNELKDEDIFDIAAILKPHYQQGLRNDFILYLSGWMRKKGIVIKSAYKIIENLTQNDEEKESRFRTLEETYRKEKLDNIKGYSGFFVSNNGSTTR